MSGQKRPNITYTEEKRFTQEQVQELFLSVDWLSGEYPSRLYQALMRSDTVLTAWDGQRLVGLVRALDDGGMLAYLHYVLVRPEYQSLGIGGAMVEKLKEKYKNYLYFNVMPGESKNAAFYQKHGFALMPDGAALQICNFSDKR